MCLTKLTPRQILVNNMSMHMFYKPKRHIDFYITLYLYANKNLQLRLDRSKFINTRDLINYITPRVVNKQNIKWENF